MKILRVFVILAVVSALVLGGTATAFAKGPPDPHPGGGKGSPGKSGLFGTVIPPVESIDDYYVIDLETDNGTVEVTINDGTKYKMPGVPGPKPDLATFVGELPERRIAALVEFTDETKTTATALRVMLIPIKERGPRVHGHRVGVVKEFIEGESITIVNKKGEETTFEGMLPEIKLLPTGTEIGAIVPGAFVTVIYSRDPGTVNFVVKGIVVHPAVPDGWSEGDEGVELNLIMNEGAVDCGNPDPADETIVGSVTLEADSDNNKIKIKVVLTDGGSNVTYAVSLENYTENWTTDCPTHHEDPTALGNLETNGDGEGELEIELDREAGTYYVQIALDDVDDGDDVWDFITEVIELTIED